MAGGGARLLLFLLAASNFAENSNLNEKLEERNERVRVSLWR